MIKRVPKAFRNDKNNSAPHIKLFLFIKLTSRSFDAEKESRFPKTPDSDFFITLKNEKINKLIDIRL